MGCPRTYARGFGAHGEVICPAPFLRPEATNGFSVIPKKRDSYTGGKLRRSLAQRRAMPRGPPSARRPGSACKAGRFRVLHVAPPGMPAALREAEADVRSEDSF